MNSPPTRQEPTTLYRFFDERHRLLYVGISANAYARIAMHSKVQPWWQRVRQATMEHFPDRPAARHAELVAIQTEHPIFNTEGRMRQLALLHTSHLRQPAPRRPRGPMTPEQKRERRERWQREEREHAHRLVTDAAFRASLLDISDRLSADYEGQVSAREYEYKLILKWVPRHLMEEAGFDPTSILEVPEAHRAAGNRNQEAPQPERG